MTTQQTIAALYVVAGLILAGLAVPMIMRLIPPNPFYGFRLPRTMKDPDLWYEINAYSGRWLFAAGLLSSLFAAVLYVLFPNLDKDLFASAQGVMVLILLGIALKASFDKLKTL